MSSPYENREDALLKEHWQGRHILSVKQFDRHDLRRICAWAKRIHLHAAKGQWNSLLRGKVLANLFYEPSTRTSSSFIAAMQRLGGQVIPINEVRYSSVSKGESLPDTVRTLESYADLIVLRHPEVGAAEYASRYASKPIINAGDGVGEHPTQALLDLFTIFMELHRLEGLKVTMLGDLKYGRTVHSLVHLLSLFDVELRYVSPSSLGMPEGVLEDLDHRKVDQASYENVEPLLEDTDVLYVTRVQRERFEDRHLYDEFKDSYAITPQLLESANSRMIIMHPFPRVHEIDMEVDRDPRAVYFRQMHYGLSMRMALLSLVLGRVQNIAPCPVLHAPLASASHAPVRDAIRRSETQEPQEAQKGFFERLEERVEEVDSILCVGLDPHREDLSAPSAEAAHDFCMHVAEQTWEHAAVFKINVAFFEALGAQGLQSLRNLLAWMPPEIPIILDAKRGDIASSASAYAHAAYHYLGAHAITLSPYLGRDGVESFVSDPKRGAFVLCKSSNESAREIQDLLLEERYVGRGRLKLYEHVAMRALSWSKHDNIALVVGATDPDAMQRVRAIAEQAWILAPGIGHQGAQVAQATRAGLRADGKGLLLSVSRGISRHPNPAHAARQICDQIGQSRTRCRRHSPSPQESFSLEKALGDLANDLVDKGCVRFGSFRLHSEIESPIYIDLRPLISHPDLLLRVAKAYLSVLQDLPSFDRLSAIPYAGLPIGTAVSIESGKPLIYPRKERKKYGTQASIEGIYQAGERVVLLDDLATTGKSMGKALEKLRQEDLQIEHAVALIDRQSGASSYLEQLNCRFHAVFQLEQLVMHWFRSERISAEQKKEIQRFIKSKPQPTSQ